jgi:hypothetical protein
MSGPLENGSPGAVLGHRDDALVLALAGGASAAEAAASSGYSLRTVKRRMAMPAFRARVDAGRSLLFERAAARLAGAMEAAVAVLTEVAADPDAAPTARVSAASRVLDAAMRARELVEIEQRLARLEARAAEGRS